MASPKKSLKAMLSKQKPPVKPKPKKAIEAYEAIRQELLKGRQARGKQQDKPLPNVPSDEKSLPSLPSPEPAGSIAVPELSLFRAAPNTGPSGSRRAEAISYHWEYGRSLESFQGAEPIINMKRYNASEQSELQTHMQQTRTLK